MTVIITRIFPDAAAAEKAAARLIHKRVPRRAIDVVAGGDAEDALRKARVDDSAVGPYAAAIAGGKAALVVRATYKPLGVAQMTRDYLRTRETVAMGAGVVEERRVKDAPEKAPSILKDHPRLLTLPSSVVGEGARGGPVTASMGMSLLKSRPAKDNLMAHDRRMSRMFWPMPLVSKRERGRSLMDHDRRMSRMFWPMPLISNSTRRKSVIPGGGPVFSRRFGWNTVS